MRLGRLQGAVGAASCLRAISPNESGMSAGITADGLTVVWGLESGNEAGDGTEHSDRTQQAGYVFSPEFVQVAASSAMFGLTATGDVYWWGGLPLQFSPLVQVVAEYPELYPLGETATEISAADDGACFLDEGGRVWCMGLNDFAQLGVPQTDLGQFEPRRIDLPGRATDIGAAGTTRCALLESGELYCWGVVDLWGVECQTDLCKETYVVTEVPQLMSGFHGVSLEVGNGGICVLDEHGKATCAGSQAVFGRGSLADPTLPPFTWEPELSFESIAVNSFNVCGLTREGRVFCAGLFPRWVHGKEGYGREGAYIPIERWYEQAKRER